MLLTALQKHTWNQTGAAYLDITRSTLLFRMQKYGLEREKPVPDVVGARWGLLHPRGDFSPDRQVVPQLALQRGSAVDLPAASAIGPRHGANRDWQIEAGGQTGVPGTRVAHVGLSGLPRETWPATAAGPRRGAPRQMCP